jgi:predicted ATPase
MIRGKATVILTAVSQIARSSSKKILISGAFGTGKSTLVRLACAALRGTGIEVSALGETPRKCPYALNYDQTTLASAWLIGEQIRAEVEALISSAGVLICDRGIPDIVSHTTSLTTEEPQAPLDVITALGSGWAKTYDLVFWAKLDPTLPIEADELRLPDKNYQAFLEAHIGRAFEALQLNPVVLPRANEERVDTVVREALKLFSR